MTNIDFSIFYKRHPMRNELVVSLYDDKKISFEAIGKHPSIVHLSDGRTLSKQRVAQIYKAVKAKRKGGEK